MNFQRVFRGWVFQQPRLFSPIEPLHWVDRLCWSDKRPAFDFGHLSARMNTGAPPPRKLPLSPFFFNELTTPSNGRDCVIAEREMRGFLEDLLFSFRMSTKNPGFTTVVLLSLSLGIAATTTIVSVLYEVLLAPSLNNDT